MKVRNSNKTLILLSWKTLEVGAFARGKKFLQNEFWNNIVIFPKCVFGKMKNFEKCRNINGFKHVANSPKYCFWENKSV